MAEVKEKETFVNPYVIQMDKFADSLMHLSKTFLTLEDYKGTFTKDEIEEMFLKITDKVCENCEKKEWCMGENRVHTYQMLYEILCAVEEYGAELNIELKRKLQKKCIMAPRFLRETLEVFENAKQILMWNNKIVQNREGYAVQLNSFAKMIQYTTRELDAGIFEDEHLEKRLKNQLKKCGVRMLSAVFYMTPQGKYEIHLTVKAMKGHLIATKEFAALVGNCVGRIMMPEQGERPIIGEEYCTVACVEGARYHTLQGVAKIGKGCEKIPSGQESGHPRRGQQERDVRGGDAALHRRRRDAGLHPVSYTHLCYADVCKNALAMPVVKGRKTDKEKFAGAEATYTIECMMK